ncbi:MAG: ribosome small subunit-dependent GTPase A [Alphaproteobacteria bacterium]|nr:ribosome small subunit-dependent GTPase A [Alphaproteobacteria bacterium]
MTLEDFGWGPHFAQQLSASDTGTLPVRVVAVHRDALDVAGPGFEGRIAGLTQRDDGQMATIGDWLLIDATHRAVRLLKRRSVFTRKSAGTGRRVQLLAANIDTMLLLTSANQDFNLARLERFLALAAEAHVEPVVLITKADLAEDVATYVASVQGLMPGIAVAAFDARSAGAAEQLQPWFMSGKTLVLLGSSGVGKSTLVNSLMGRLLQETQAVRGDDDKGRHTTSARSLHRLANGAWLIDTPGIRELQLIEAAQGVDDVFDDIAQLAATCRFSNCTHLSEPGCAVQAAVIAGTLDEPRLRRFQKLQAEERQNSTAIARAKRPGRLAKRVR